MPRRPSPNSNRTDLNRPAPVTTVTGQTYGDAAAQEASQRIQPMAGGATQTPGAPASSAPPPAAPTPQGASGPSDMMAALQAHVAGGGGAGGRGSLTRPTERPNEPVTHGLPMGPGGGPEALQGVGALTRDNAVEQGTLSHLLQSMATQPGATQAVQDLANRALSGAL